MHTEWKETGANNQILEKTGFYLSFNPDCSRGLCGMFDQILGINQTEETAICWEDKYYILNGDHREELENRDSVEECLDYFLENSDLHAPTSDEFVLE